MVFTEEAFANDVSGALLKHADLQTIVVRINDGRQAL
jgi:hypothetical protein